MAKRKPYIRASEIGTYAFCRRAWWLQRMAGIETQGIRQRLEAGIMAHSAHGKQAKRVRTARFTAYLCFFLAALSLLLAVLLVH
ncbi:hypothetical protein [Candidatus Chlorohelix sp.]|uniref:hypothetical protein n=1 Tax=Candidatus Chlorohelix sp. TaxID=3139201 RepID=UPI003042E4A9